MRTKHRITHTYIHTYIHTRIHIQTFKQSTFLSAEECIHTYIHTYSHTYTHTHIQTFKQNTFLSTHTHTHTPTAVLSAEACVLGAVIATSECMEQIVEGKEEAFDGWKEKTVAKSGELIGAVSPVGAFALREHVFTPKCDADER